MKLRWRNAGITAVMLSALLVVGYMVLSVPATAAPTLSDIVLTNIAQINWDSGTVNKSTNVSNFSLTVGTNYGMVWIGETNKIVPAGDVVSNLTILSNSGNATADFFVGFNSNAIANANSTEWTNYFTNTNVGGEASNLLVVTLPPAAAQAVLFVASVPPNETNNAFMVYQCLVTNSNAVANLGVGATNYTGFNLTVYGGDMGLYDAGAGVAWLSNSQAVFSNWVVTVKVADIRMTKEVAFTNPEPYAAAADPVPGALITYKITFTNQGGLTGTGVRIVDTLPTNYVDYMADSMRLTTWDHDVASYDTIVGGLISDGEGDDTGSTNSTAADQIVFTPTNGQAPTVGGSVDPDDNGSYFFQVYLK